jgi:hypothetical protein
MKVNSDIRNNPFVARRVFSALLFVVLEFTA